MAKTLVAVMSFLIIVVVGMMVYGFYQKSLNPDYKMFRDNAMPVRQAAPTTNPTVSAGPDLRLEDIALNLPPSARVMSTQITQGRLILLIARDGERTDLVVIVDVNSGQVVRRIATTP